jgi:transcriptional regulator with XRE-family HTH domain
MPRLRSDRGPSASTLSARVRAARGQLGLTQEAMAARLGITRGTYKQSEESVTPLYSTVIGLVVEGGMDPRILCPELVEAIDRARLSDAP